MGVCKLLLILDLSHFATGVYVTLYSISQMTLGQQTLLVSFLTLLFLISFGTSYDTFEFHIYRLYSAAFRNAAL
jgi:hypothetical protein